MQVCQGMLIMAGTALAGTVQNAFLRQATLGHHYSLGLLYAYPTLPYAIPPKNRAGLMRPP